MAIFECDIPKEHLGGARENIKSIDERAMEIAKIEAEGSLDPNTQVGACLYFKDKNLIISTGRNNPPKDWKGDFPYRKDAENKSYWKYPYIEHAETSCIDNALYNTHFSREELSSATMAVTLYPCQECARRIGILGLKKLVYLNRKADEDPNKALEIDIFFKHMGVEVIKYSDLINKEEK